MDEVAGWVSQEKSTLPISSDAFSGSHPDWKGCGTSTIRPVEGGVVLGVAYMLTDEQVEQLRQDAAPYQIRENVALIDKVETPVYTLQPQETWPVNPPADEYLALVRRGLTTHYQEEIVDLYLARALRRARGEDAVPLKTPTSESIKREYGCDFRRLFPWPATRTQPFGSAWATLKPGDQTTPQAHDEEETFVVVSGEALVNIDGYEFTARKGDTVYIEPFTSHTVINNGADPFEMLCIWWGEVAPAAAPQT